jgi:hypothetical protein
MTVGNGPLERMVTKGKEKVVHDSSRLLHFTVFLSRLAIPACQNAKRTVVSNQRQLFFKIRSAPLKFRFSGSKFERCKTATTAVPKNSQLVALPDRFWSDSRSHLRPTLIVNVS